MKLWDDKNFFSPEEAKQLGDRRFTYVAFKDLHPEDQKEARRAYFHSGGKYKFIPEHYYYPIKKDKRLGNARRTLAIPYVKVQNEKYMRSLGYTIDPDWEHALDWRK